MSAGAAVAHKEWDYWISALRGEPLELTVGKAEWGFYRHRTRSGQMIPLQIWRDECGLRVKWGPNRPTTVLDEEEFCERVFCYCCRHPVTAEWYDYWLKAYAEEGAGRWPDEAPPPAVSKSNLPADPFEALKVEVESELAELEAALKPGIADDVGATRFGNWRLRFAQAWKRLEELRKTEKKPHDDAARAIQEKYLPVQALAKKGEDLIKGALTKHLQLQAKLAREAMPSPANDEPAPKPAVQTVARRVSLTTTWRAEIVDYHAALAALRDHPDVKATVQRIADAAARSKEKQPIPGVTFVESSSAR
ncbi:hypothetical protein [Microvirga massiliensis]|uniref:hypothetical protein n=1 Tax=Microvirga massiliensis TaxID=1033741 RepID=UPI00062B34D7|nr:hypothetical protein [Microvirga massiliensis]